MIATGDQPKAIIPGETPVSFSLAAPVPHALPLLATGLGALGALGGRRKRKQAQAQA
jgi:hypothetical protein